MAQDQKMDLAFYALDKLVTVLTVLVVLHALSA